MSPKNIVKCILCDMDGVLRIGTQPIQECKTFFIILKN